MGKKDYHDEPLITVYEQSGYDAEFRGEVKRVIHAYWIERERKFAGDYGNNWKDITRWTIICSDCGAEFLGGDLNFRYCPNCGAKMDLKPRGAVKKYGLMTGWMKKEKE